jgi:CRISPR/Cas system-associated exonuclease Cas4 (RecB family)
MAVAKSDLKKFLDATKYKTRLTGPVERHLLSRPPGDRDYTVLHPSEMIKRSWCHRAAYFLLQGHPRIGERPNLRLQSIFDEGHAIHAKWQKWFQEMGVLHGQFECLVCDKVTWGTSPKACEHCDAPEHKLVYAEVTMRDDKLRIKGHTDGWIKGVGDDTLIEIKSIGPGTIRNESPDLFRESSDFMAAWKNVRRPFNSHLLQGQMYLELMKRMGHEVNEIVFLYELKADQDYKEFVIQADYELVRHVFENAEKVNKAVEKEQAPLCNNNIAGTCSQCEGYRE